LCSAIISNISPMRDRSSVPAAGNTHLIRIAMKAGYPQAIKTANESGRIKF
jgi:hypothetical protein